MLKALILSFIFVGCASVKTIDDRIVEISDRASLTLPEPNQILPPMELVQFLTIDYQGKKRSSQVVLTSKDNRLLMVALMPLGGEVFRVEYADGKISSKSLPMTAKDLDLKYALADVIMVYSNQKALQSWLSKGVKVEGKVGERSILLDKELIVRIKYEGKDLYSSSVEYEHLARNYKISIKPVSQVKL